MKQVVILGTGGHAKVVCDIVLSAGDAVRGFLTADEGRTTFLGFPVLGKESDWVRYQEECEFVIAIGNAAVRERLVSEMVGARFYTAVHPTAALSRLDCEVGEGSVIGAMAVVNPGAKIGRHCIVNTAAAVEHDCVVGDFAHVSVGAKLVGSSSVAARSWIGAGAVVSAACICADCMIGAGAVVVRDVTEPGTYVGVPAKRIK